MNRKSAICFCIHLTVFSMPSHAQSLYLETVQQAAVRAFPALLASEQRKQLASGDVQTAQGAFDTSMKVKNTWSVSGLYENQNYDVAIEQATPFLGSTFFGGWRRGSGYYPIYDGKSQTASEGEARIGVTIPLWRNREIDRRRSSLQQSELAQLIASHDYDQILLDVRKQASYRYWDWVLAGQRLKIAGRLLEFAQQRDQGIRKRAALGEIPDFEILDNQRAIIERQERLVAAQRLLDQASIQLSLYWRDAQGLSQMPSNDLLPDHFPKQTITCELSVDMAIEKARHQRPELKKLDTQRKQIENELQFQENQTNPGIDITAMTAQDIGTGKATLNRDEVYLGVSVDVPLQQRVAGGRIEAARANLQRIKWESMGMDERISSEVKDVFSALHAMQKRIELTLHQQKIATQLQEGEQARFDLGDSNLLFVNLRELAASDASLQVLETTTQLYKIYADYQAALASSIENLQHSQSIGN